jgi:hypothetical protein
MSMRFSTMFMTGILVATCTAMVALPLGCQSSTRTAATQVSGTCPVCGHVTRTQPFTGLKYTTCICPKCKKVSTLDPRLQDSFERFFGEDPAFTVTVCDGCQAVLQECAVCREAESSQPSK